MAVNPISISNLPRAPFGRAAVLAFVLGAATLPGSAKAQPIAVTDLAELAGTYKGICIDHAGQPDQQIDAAGDYGLEQQVSEAGDQTLRFTNDRLSLSIQSTPDLALCMIAARVPDGTSPALVATQALPLLDAPVTAIAVQERSLSWKLGDASGLYVQVRDARQVLGSFSLASPATP